MRQRGRNKMSNDRGFNTRAIHLGTKKRDSRIISESITPAVAYAFDSVEDAASVVTGEEEGIYYGRYGNPTTEKLEQAMAGLEGAEASLAVSSGMAAISIAILNYVKPGDHLIVTKDIYGGTHKFLSNIAQRHDIAYDFVDCANPASICDYIKDNTKAIYIETPSNPSLRIIDLEKMGAISDKFQLPLIVDNTFMTPYLQNPIKHGADIVVHSATKYLNGHGDVVAGIVCGKKQDIDHMRKNIMGDFGQNLNAWEAYFILRGLKTLGLRVNKHCENALAIAAFLDKHPAIEKVYYPGLETHPKHDVCHTQMKAMGGIIAFEVKGGFTASKKFINHLQLALISFSLGDPETLVQHPASMTHSSIPEEELHQFGISPGLIRLSAGLEDVEDIIHDLEQALATIQ